MRLPGFVRTTAAVRPRDKLNDLVHEKICQSTMKVSPPRASAIRSGGGHAIFPSVGVICLMKIAAELAHVVRRSFRARTVSLSGGGEAAAGAFARTGKPVRKWERKKPAAGLPARAAFLRQ
jgi:hypothetical protein